MKMLLARIEALERKRTSRLRPYYIVQLDTEEPPEQAYQRYVDTYGKPGHMIVMLPPDISDSEWMRIYGNENYE